MSSAICAFAAGCSSVQYTSQAELSAVQTVVPTPRPTEDERFAAVPTANPAQATAFAATNSENAAIAAATMPAVVSSKNGTLQPAAYAEIPLTPEMSAIQSVVPTPRPSTPASPSTQLAFAGSPAASFPGMNTSSRSMTDFGFDTTGPMDPPAAPPMFSDSDDDGAPTVEKSAIVKIIEKYSRLYEVPATLLHRVVHRESRYNPRAYNKRGYFGLMQIKYNTAKSMGYDGSPSGLFDPETNIKFAAKYLRGAWLVSNSKEDDAVRLYARGYYYEAKRKGMTDTIQN